MYAIRSYYVLGGVIAAIISLVQKDSKSTASSEQLDENALHANLAEDECCGAHEICDKDLEKLLSDKPIYFDDDAVIEITLRGPISTLFSDTSDRTERQFARNNFV